MGEDKARVDWLGRPLALHVAAILSAVCPRVVLVGGAGRGYESLGLPWLPDPPGLAGRGPLAGLLAALRIAPAVLLVACDLPYLEPNVLRRLVAAAGRSPAAMPLLPGRRLEPLAGVYRREALPLALRSLACGSGRMSDLLAVPGARLIPAGALGSEGEVFRAFTNLNRAIDVSQARSQAHRTASSRS